MRLLIAVIVMLITGTVALAQSRDYSGPFTGYEAEALSDVWPEIRGAAHFEDINWRAHGLSGPPGNSEAQRLLSGPVTSVVVPGAGHDLKGADDVIVGAVRDWIVGLSG